MFVRVFKVTSLVQLSRAQIIEVLLNPYPSKLEDMSLHGPTTL